MNTPVISVTGWILTAIVVITAYSSIPKSRPVLTGLIIIVLLGMILHGEPQFVASIKSITTGAK